MPPTHVSACHNSALTLAQRKTGVNDVDNISI